MLVGRINKQPLQVSRFTVNCTEYLDEGETIIACTVPVITVLGTAWTGPGFGNPMGSINLPPPPPPPNTNPLALVGTYILIDDTMVQVFLQQGTVGLNYQVQFVITGSSNRQLPIEVNCQVNGP